MKAVVFNGEPGDGQAYVTSFASEEDAHDFADTRGVMVFTESELRDEYVRLLRWRNQAREEVSTAERKANHALDMLAKLSEYEEKKTVAEQLDAAQTGEEFGQVISDLFTALERIRDGAK